MFLRLYNTLKDESHRSVGVQYSTGEKQEMAPERMKRLSQRRNDAQLCLCLVVKVKSGAVKSSMKTCKTF